MTRERYESISLHDLREIAKNRGMRRISTLKKAELIDAMMQKDEEEAKALREEKKAQRSRAAAAAAAAAASQG
jgi:transcription termination factor Rho